MKFHYFDVELYMKLILQMARSKIKKDMLWVVRVMIERILSILVISCLPCNCSHDPRAISFCGNTIRCPARLVTLWQVTLLNLNLAYS